VSRRGPYEDKWRTPDFSSPRYSQSLERGLAILECFGSERPVLGLAEIAEELGMSRSTTHRYLTTLAALGYMEQDKSRKYRLSLRVTNLGMSAINGMGLRQHAHSILEELRDRSKFTASVALLDDAVIVYADCVASIQHGLDSTTVVGFGIGSRLPSYCTASGKLLLAHLPKEDQRELLSHTALELRGPKAITSKSVLRVELQEVLENEFATEDEEFEKGRIAISAPIRNESSEVVAAVELSAQTSKITVEQLAGGLLPHLLTAADHISARLGHRREDER
jgi:IclR family transcriptional regulator, pca regulon regulatory protein